MRSTQLFRDQRFSVGNLVCLAVVFAFLGWTASSVATFAEWLTKSSVVLVMGIYFYGIAWIDETFQRKWNQHHEKLWDLSFSRMSRTERILNALRARRTGKCSPDFMARLKERMRIGRAIKLSEQRCDVLEDISYLFDANARNKIRFAWGCWLLLVFLQLCVLLMTGRWMPLIFNPFLFWLLTIRPQQKIQDDTVKNRKMNLEGT